MAADHSAEQDDSQKPAEGRKHALKLQSHQDALGAFAEAAAALQARVNLHIGWAMIASLPIPPELYDANAKLVDVTRQLRAAAGHATEDAPLHQGTRQVEQAVQQEAATHGR